MENYLLLRILHGLATLLFFGGLVGLGWYGWRNFRSGDAALVGASLRRIALFGCIAWLLLFGRLGRLREQAQADGGPGSAQVRRSLKFGAAYGLVGLLLFLSVLALMLAKPL
jgi:uncharacterized membrane protein